MVLKPKRVLLKATGQYKLTPKVSPTFPLVRPSKGNHPKWTHSSVYEDIYYRISRNGKDLKETS